MSHYYFRSPDGSRPSYKELFGAFAVLSEALTKDCKQDGYDEDMTRVAIFLTFGTVVQDTRLLHGVTRWPLPWLRTMRQRARELKLWFGCDKTTKAWFDEKHGRMALLLDTMVMTGDMERLRSGDEYTYRLSEKGLRRYNDEVTDPSTSEAGPAQLWSVP